MTCGDLSLIARDEIATGVPSISHNQVLTHPWRTTQGHWLRLSIICWSIAFAAANMCRSCLPSTAEAGQSRAQISHDQLWSHSLDVHWTASHTELLWLVCVYRGSINYTKSHVTFHSESSLNCCVLLILGYQVGFWSCTRHFYLICTQIISHDDVTDNCMNLSAVYTLARNCSQQGRCFTEFFRLYTTRTIITAVKFRRKLVVEARASWRTISGKPPNLASLPKSCNLLGWDLGYSEATDQVRWMRASPVAAAWLSRVPCAPVHCLVVTRRSRQTPAVSYGR